MADLDGANGGQGWTTAWSGGGNGEISVTGPGSGLSFGRLGVKGGLAEVPYSPDMVDYSRGHGAIDGATMYVSFLLRPRADASNWFTLRFGTYPGQVDVGVPLGSDQYGFMLGDGLFAFTPVPVQFGKAVFLVLEIEQVAANNRTAYRLYVNPEPGQPEPGWAMAEYARAGVRPFGSYVTALGYGGFDVDELRIGSSWSQVTPCAADFDADGFVNGNDFDAFVGAFEVADSTADINGDGFVTGDDFDLFTWAFIAGC